MKFNGLLVLRVLVVVGVISLLGLALVINHYYFKNQKAVANEIPRAEKEIKIKAIIDSPEFQEKIKAEAERIYYEQVKKEADTKLLELEKSGFSGEKVSMLESFLKKYNPDLAKYAHEIVELPRWIEVVAIAGVETTYCKYGVGETKNNCGAIVSSHTGQFKAYKNHLDSIKDIAYLLQKDMYKDKTITEMNGLYCVDESRADGKCEGWDKKIISIVSQLET